MMELKIEQIENQIINNDCLKILKHLPDKCIDLILTDPPYGIGNRFKSKFGLQIQYRTEPSFEWNNQIPSAKVFKEMFRVSKNQIIFGGNYFTKYLKPTNSWLVWDKIGEYDLKTPFSDCELAWTSFKCTMKKYTVVNMGFIAQPEEKAKRIHPTQKPLTLFKMILRDFSKENDLILDCFSGSGTTAIACSELKRRFICIEKDEIYCRKSRERLENFNNQLKFDFGAAI